MLSLSLRRVLVVMCVCVDVMCVCCVLSCRRVVVVMSLTLLQQVLPRMPDTIAHVTTEFGPLFPGRASPVCHTISGPLL